MARAGSHCLAERSIGRVAPADLPRVTALLQAANRAGPDRARGDVRGRSGAGARCSRTRSRSSRSRGDSPGCAAPFSSALFALMAMVAVVLLVTCANIANLMLARAARRSRDVAIRISLGATTGRLIRQGLTESVMLASLGGAAGLLAGEWASGFLAHQVLGSSGQLPPAFAPDARVLVFAAGLSLADRDPVRSRARASRDPGRTHGGDQHDRAARGRPVDDEGHAPARHGAARPVGRRRVRRRPAGSNLDQFHTDGSRVRAPIIS